MDLIQPRHSYAPETGQWPIYTNTSLWTIWSILDAKWIDITLHDENFKKVSSLQSNIVGINLLWAPYIPVAIETIQRLKKQFWDELTFILWWQVLTQKQSKTWKVLWLDDGQFQKVFWKNVYNGMKPWVLESLLNIKNISDWHNISLIPMYEKLSDSEFKEYFSREISFYVSQWCKFDCEFCGAVKNQKEQYRDEEILYSDLCYITSRLQRLWKKSLSIYMSNLDVFQSPRQLEWFADMVLQIKTNNPDFSFSIRGLAGTKSFIDLDKNNPQILEKLVSAWFNNVWYGVDGMWPDIWKWIKKTQNNQKEILDSIRLSKEKYNITPELLMVFWHIWVDTETSLQNAYSFVEAMVDTYGAVPRPHVAKPFIPGSDWWKNHEFQDKIKLLIENPHLFQSLDFTALASKVTHTDLSFRNLVNHYYLEMCKLPWNTTLPIIPYDIWDTESALEYKRRKNIGKFDR